MPDTKVDLGLLAYEVSRYRPIYCARYEAKLGSCSLNKESVLVALLSNIFTHLFVINVLITVSLIADKCCIIIL